MAGVSAVAEARELLATAARIEHAIMVEYLRVAFVAKDARISQILTRIAGEELCHLLTVQNLRLMLGAEPNLERQSFTPPPASGPFPLHCREFSLDCLARYVCCEAPPFNQVRDEQRRTFAKAQRFWSETAPFVNRVGALYAKIYWLFMDDDLNPDGWSDLPVDLLGHEDAGRHVPEPSSHHLGRQLGSADWPEVVACGSKQAARAAILEVAGHGEGGPARPGSHFDQLLEAYALAEVADSLRSDPAPAVRVEPTLDALYNLVTSEVLLAFTFETNDDSSATARRALLATARNDWECLSGLARGGLRAAPHLALTAPTCGDRSTLSDGLDSAIENLQGGLDSLLDPTVRAPDASWASELRRHVGSRQSLALQVRAMLG